MAKTKRVIKGTAKAKGSRKTKIQRAVLAAYRRGVRDGVQKECKKCTQKKMRLLAIANRNLWEILTELDRTDPVEGLVLSYDMAERVTEALAKGQRRIKLANLIRRQVDESDTTFHLLMRQLLDPEERPDI